MKLALTQTSVEKSEAATKVTEYRDTRLKGLILRITPKGVKTYYCELARGNRICIGRADAIGLSTAREVAKDHIADFVKGIDPRVLKQRQKRIPTFEEYLTNEFDVWARANQKAHKQNIDRLRTAFKKFLKTPLDDLRPVAIEAWRAQQFDRGLSAHTIRRDIASIKASLNRAVDMDIILRRPRTIALSPATIF